MVCLVLLSIDVGSAFLIEHHQELPETVFISQLHPVFTYRPTGSFVEQPRLLETVKDFRNNSFAQRKKPDVTRILMNGASTMWGHLLEDNECLSALLEKYLHEEHPDRSWEVLCIAFPGKFQMNELVETVTAVPYWEPDLVISFNGYNEVWYGENPARYFGQPYIDGQLQFSASDLVLAGFSHVGMLRVQGVGVFADSMWLNAEYIPETRFFGDLEQTCTNLSNARIRYAFGFCPGVWDLQNPGPEDSRFIAEQESAVCYAVGENGTVRDVAKARAAKSKMVVERAGQTYVPVGQMINAVEADQVFIDECHLTRQATEALAVMLSKEIPGWLETRLSDGQTE